MIYTLKSALYLEGKAAYWQAKHIGFNPYKPGSADYKNWEAGWYDASDDDLHHRSAMRDEA